MDEEQNDDIELTEENTEAYIKKIKEQLKICKSEKGEYLAGWQRAKADFVNARRDEERRIDDAKRYAKESVLREILFLADFIDLALAHESSDGLIQTQKQLQEILKKQGIQQIECIQKEFDPAMHEALMSDDVDAQDKDNIILEELQKGFMLDGKVIRPSKVKVGIYKK